MDLFEHDDYRSFLRNWLKSLPKKGYGQLSRLAQHLGVNATLVSQVMAGQKNFTEDQAYSVAEFLGLNERESYYLVLLVQRDRAGNHRLKKLLANQIRSYRTEAQSLKNRIVDRRQLSFEEQAVFYSNFLYTIVHNMTSVPRFQSLEAIADHLSVSRTRAKQILDWLVEHGMCLEKNGKIVIGPATTFVPAESPLASRHHANWRQRGLDKMTDPLPENFFFTGPFSASEEDFLQIRKELVVFVDRLAKRIEKSDPQTVGTINIDLFKN